MVREVDLVSYLPPFMQDYKEPSAALRAENPEFTLVWKAVDKILYNHFISTADEYGIARYEKILGIYPPESDTLEARRARVQSRWFSRLPYTWKMLLQKLTALCGETDFTLTHNFSEGYTLTAVTHLEQYGQAERLEEIINTMVPCNIVVDAKNRISCVSHGTVLFDGGLCFVERFSVANDFREKYRIHGRCALGGGIAINELKTVTT